MLITGIFSGKMPVAKVVARDSYNANMLAALSPCSKFHCIKFAGEMCP